MLDVDGVPIHEDLKPLLWPADDLREHPENARKGNVAAIKESVRQNGVYKPVVAQRSTGYILSGNHTYRGLTELGALKVPVAWVDVNDEQARRILLADNRTTELGTYDEVQLADLLTTLSEGEGTGLVGTGYSDDDLADLLVGMEAPPEVEAAPRGAHKTEDQFNEDGATTTAGFVDGQRKVLGRRMLVLDLPVPVWLWLIGHLEELGKDWNMDSNADVVLKLVADHTGSEVPEGEAVSDAA